MDYSVVEYFGKDAGHSCGYCKLLDTSLSHGMWSHRLTCRDYEDLLNRGWRRSGKYCYKPTMDKTCCPQYSIRCNVTQIKLTKSQKKVIKRVNKYLISGKRPVNMEDVTDTSKQLPSSVNDAMEVTELQPKMQDLVEDIQIKNEISTSPSFEDKAKSQSSLAVTKNISAVDRTKPRCRKAKERRNEKRVEKLRKSAEDNGTIFDPSQAQKTQKDKEKSLEDLIDNLPTQLAHKLEVKLVYCNQSFEDFSKTYKDECELFKCYQMGIHKETAEDSDEKQFCRFLVEGPLQPVKKEDDDSIPSTGLGAFHQQYYIDGKLVAVGVLDILPHCVSSKYLFYDPDYSFLSLGTYSALREIYFVRSLHRECPAMKYYYMGYYIHSCPKMKYKGKYHPSYLLCPESYTWQPIETCIPKLDVNKYSRLEEDKNKKPSHTDVNSALVLHQRQAMPFPVYALVLDESDEASQKEEVSEYANLAGVAATRILLYRS